MMLPMFVIAAKPISMEQLVSDRDFKRWLCLGCGFSYDEALGLPSHGILPGTRWADIPDDWCCPDCGTPKHLFEMVEIPYAPGQPAPQQPSR
jgi:rubredoxin